MSGVKECSTEGTKGRRVRGLERERKGWKEEKTVVQLGHSSATRCQKNMCDCVCIYITGKEGQIPHGHVWKRKMQTWTLPLFGHPHI